MCPWLSAACISAVDVGSVSTNLVLLDHETDDILAKLYLRTNGAPIHALAQGMRQLREAGEWDVFGVGATGSGRQLAAAIIGADVVKNEITAHAVAALKHNPQAATVIEIGGQDSKIILIRNGVVSDFAMNTICAAGTGSFLDQQAARLGISVQDFGDIALQSRNPVRIAGRCTVFAESDMIHKQQLRTLCSRHLSRAVQGHGPQLSKRSGQRQAHRAPSPFPGRCSRKQRHPVCTGSSTGAGSGSSSILRRHGRRWRSRPGEGIAV